MAAIPKLFARSSLRAEVEPVLLLPMLRDAARSLPRGIRGARLLSMRLEIDQLSEDARRESRAPSYELSASHTRSGVAGMLTFAALSGWRRTKPRHQLARCNL
jgi:hypothetical protein